MMIETKLKMSCRLLVGCLLVFCLAITVLIVNATTTKETGNKRKLSKKNGVKTLSPTTTNHHHRRHEDFVHSVPLYDGLSPTQQYSGFLNLNGTDGCSIAENGKECMVHYILALAEFNDESNGYDSENQDLHYERAMSAPTLLWMNGGPGASSAINYFNGVGPFLFTQNGTQLYPNPYRWTKAEVNVLIFESPLGVGYSYCSNQFSPDNGYCAGTDTSTAKLNRAALLEFFKTKFPRLAENDLFIVGQSYAGVYIPTLAKEILEGNENNSNEISLKLKSIAAGNPCTDVETQAEPMNRCWYSNRFGLLNSTFYDTLTSDECKEYVKYTRCGMSGNARPPPMPPSFVPPPKCLIAFRKIMVSTSNVLQPRWEEEYVNFHSLYGLIEDGSENPLEAYMNRPDVRIAYNMENSPVREWFLAGGRGGTLRYRMQFMACSYATNEVEFNNTSMVDFYREISPKLTKTWIYNGGTDPGVVWLGTRRAVEKIGFSVEKNGDYRPWFYPKNKVSDQQILIDKSIMFGTNLIPYTIQPQFGGEVVNYEHGLSFFTVHGSGHAVPMIAPEQALHIVKKLVGSQTAMLSPPLPSDEVLLNSSEEEYQAALVNWTILARSYGLK